MVQRRAITHADLAPSPSSTDLGSTTAAFMMILTIICGLCCFILCLIADAFRSQVSWVSSDRKGNDDKHECIYTSSGEMPLLCAGIAFVGLAVAVVVQHLYLLIAISKAPPQTLIWYSSPEKTISWVAGLFFVATWICFAVGEILLLIGLSVESGHLNNWTRPRPSCLVIKEGLFSAAGVCALLTVFLAAGLYLTALRAQRISQEHENVRQEILDASALYASPLNSPPPRIAAIERESPVVRDSHIEQPSFMYPQVLGKNLNLV